MSSGLMTRLHPCHAAEVRRAGHRLYGGDDIEAFACGVRLGEDTRPGDRPLTGRNPTAGRSASGTGLRAARGNLLLDQLRIGGVGQVGARGDLAMAAAECLGFRHEAVSFAQPSGGLFGGVLDVLQDPRQLRCVVFARI
jgi:hypothetical protein